MADYDDNELKQTELPNVIITGFGPFRDHVVNPSWEAIKDPIKIDRPVNVIVKEIEVAYDVVDEEIPHLWSKYKPILMIHVGLCAHDRRIRFETNARYGPYHHPDIRGRVPNTPAHHNNQLHQANIHNLDHPHITEDLGDSNDVAVDLISLERATNNNKLELRQQSQHHQRQLGLIHTCLKLNWVVERMIKDKQDGIIELEVGESHDAGLYVCEYIYLRSLIQNTRASFIHIPHTDECPLEQIKQALKLAIEYLVDAAMNVDEMSAGEKSMEV